MNHLQHLVSNQKVFFNFMNENFKIVQHSNLFLRDLQYAIMSYFEMKENQLKYAEAETVAKKYIDHLLENNDFTQIDYKSWKINFEVGIKKKEIESEGVGNE